MLNVKSWLKYDFKNNLYNLFDVFLFVVIFLNIASFVFGLTFPASDLRWKIIVLSVSSVTLIIVFISLFLNAEKRTNLSLGFLSIYSTFFIVNLGVEIKDNFIYFNMVAKTNAQKASLSGTHPKKKERLEIITDLRNSGVDAYPAPLTPTFEIFDSLFQGSNAETNPIETNSMLTLGGISKVTNVFCTQREKATIYESDRYGFNNGDEIYDNPGGKILLLGDSYGHGYCVLPGEDVGGVLRKKGYPAINLSISGNGPLRELATLREYGAHLNPKIILWLYYDGNDSTNLKNEIKIPILKKYLDKTFSQNLIKRQREVDELWKSVVNRTMERKVIEKKQRKLLMIEKESDLERFFRGVDLKRSLKYVFTLYHVRNIMKLSVADAYLGDLKKVLSRAQMDSENLGAKFYFVYLASGEFLSRSIAPRGRQKVLEVLNELGIPLVDFYETLKKQKDPLSFTEGHYNAKGYKLLADTIEEEVLSKAWIEGTMLGQVDN
jgi:hypothetical protein